MGHFQFADDSRCTAVLIEPADIGKGQLSVQIRKVDVAQIDVDIQPVAVVNRDAVREAVDARDVEQLQGVGAGPFDHSGLIGSGPDALAEGEQRPRRIAGDREPFVVGDEVCVGEVVERDDIGAEVEVGVEHASRLELFDAELRRLAVAAALTATPLSKMGSVVPQEEAATR